MNEITCDLQGLTACGFEFAHPRDAGGALVAVVGLRVLDEVIDVIKLFDEEDAEALRVPSDEADILFPGRVLWRAAGTSDEVIEEVLALDAASTRHHMQPTGYWPPAPAHPVPASA